MVKPVTFILLVWKIIFIYTSTHGYKPAYLTRESWRITSACMIGIFYSWVTEPILQFPFTPKLFLRNNSGIICVGLPHWEEVNSQCHLHWAILWIETIKGNSYFSEWHIKVLAQSSVCLWFQHLWLWLSEVAAFISSWGCKYKGV